MPGTFARRRGTGWPKGSPTYERYPKHRVRLCRRWRVSCSRKVPRKYPRFQRGVPRWRTAQAPASGRCAISRKARF
eukprot:5823229-Pyramimonas_sp.AAC.1